jgi:hypothetical protein
LAAVLDRGECATATNVRELLPTANYLKAMTGKQIVDMRKRMRRVSKEFFRWTASSQSSSCSGREVGFRRLQGVPDRHESLDSHREYYV